MNACPSEHHLNRLLANELATDEETEVAGHVERCPRCQRALDRLTTPGPRSGSTLTTEFVGRPARQDESDNRPTDASLRRLRDLIRPPSSAAFSGPSEGRPVVPGYVILEELGRGGMGVVYKARHLGLNRVVALKLAAGRLLSPEERVRFLAEAEVVASVQHPHVVQVYDSGRHGELPYCALEFVAGGSLADLLRAGPLPPTVAARLVEQVACGVQAVHERGIVHRDLKPSNVLLGIADCRLKSAELSDQSAFCNLQSATPKVTDFGLAKRVEGGGVTLSGAVVGTPSYMPPEQARGEGKHALPALDVYALGAVLYECLTGRPPFQAATSADTLVQVLSNDPVPVRTLQPKCPRDLETICLKCLHKEPARRYPTAAALAEDLRRFREGRPIAARPVGAAERLGRWWRRNPVPASLLAALVLVFLMGFTGVFWQWQVAESASQDEKNQRTIAEAARERAEGILYFSNIAQAQLEYRANNVDGAEALLDRCPAQRRGWEWHYLKQLCHADLFTRDGHTGWVWAVAYSPDGRLLASAGGGNAFADTDGPGSERPGEVILRNAADGSPLRTLRGHTHQVLSVAFSPDGRWLASASQDGTARVWDVATGAELRTFPGLKHPGAPRQGVRGLTSVAFSPDGKLLAAGSHNTVAVWNLTDDRRRPPSPMLTLRIDPHNAAHITGLAFSPDGRRLAAGSHYGQWGMVRVWDLPAGTETLQLEAVGGINRGHGLAFSPDGRYLAAAQRGGIIKLCDAGTGRLLQTIAGHHGDVFGVAFSPDGRQLASAGADGTARVWSIPEGQELHLFRGHRGGVRGVAFSADGMRLASGGIDGRFKVWDLTLRPEYGDVLGVHQVGGEPESLAFTERGGRLVVAARNGHVRTLDYHPGWQVGAPQRVGLRGVWLVPAEPVCLDADGCWLAGISADDRKEARCWDVQTGRERVRLRGHTLPLGHVTLSRGGSRIATGGCPPRDQPPRLEVKVWDGSDGRPLLELDEPHLTVTRLALSPSGDRLAVAALRTESGAAEALLRVYDLGRREVVRSFADGSDPYCALAFSADGTRLAAAGHGGRAVLVWDLESERPAVTHQGPEGALDVAFSPDGRRLAVASQQRVKLLDAATGEEVLILRGRPHVEPDTNGFNPRVRFSPDGQWIAAICHDYRKPISLWSAGEESAPGSALRLQTADRRAVTTHTQAALESSRDPRHRQAFLFHLEQLEGAPLAGAVEHLNRGRLHAWNGQRDRAKADLARAAELAPDSAEVYYLCGEACAAAGLWEEAAPYFARYARLAPDDRRAPRTVACLLLYLNEPATYRRYCRELLEHFGRSVEPDVVQAVLRWGLLAGDSGVNSNVLLELADRCLVRTHPTYGQMLLAKGMAEYRAGRMEQAVAWLRKAEPQVNTFSRAGLGFFLSMAYQRLNRGDEARAAYAQALRLTEQEFGTVDRYQPGKGSWSGWLWCQVLRREAEAVLNESKPPAPG